MIHHSPADWLMHHLVDEAAPELEHLLAGVPCGGPSDNRKYFGELHPSQCWSAH
jgi:hypothetical protein